MKKIMIDAPAKINVFLDILQKRDDGYHEIETVMLPIKLKDIINLEKTNENSIVITTNNKKLPTNKSNICYKIADEFFRNTNANFTGLRINIENNIPNEAGLGGGSADGAATLIGLNKIYNTFLTEKTLVRIGAKVGSDIPFCIINTPCLAKGKGEILKKINTSLNFPIIIIKPNVNSSTKIAYENYSKMSILKKDNISTIIAALENNNIYDLSENLYNIFENIINIKEIDEMKNILIQYGAVGSLMTGSGTAVFGIFSDYHGAKEAFLKISKIIKHQIFLTETLI